MSKAPGISRGLFILENPLTTTLPGTMLKRTLI
jgi:hypothetical protein